jgi:hypothetical protein
MRGAIHPLPQYAFMAWCSVNHRDNFTFYLFYNINSITDNYQNCFMAMISVLDLHTFKRSFINNSCGIHFYCERKRVLVVIL